jgi:uncharacterized membrane protein
MFQRALALWHTIRTSLWAIPFAMVCVAAAGALLAARIRLVQGGDPVWWLYSGGTESAPEFLGNLVSAMITMATLAISITMVVLTLAAQQLGPRLIRRFMSDRTTQLSLGLLISTVIYLLIVLRSTYGAGDNAPNLAVTIGTGLVLLSVVVLVLFVHHLAWSIVADNVIDRIGAELESEIDRLLPEKTEGKPGQPLRAALENGAELRLSTGGYVQAVDFDRLVKLACEIDAVIELEIRAGHHVIEGRRIGVLLPASAANDEVRRTVSNAILRGGERTPIQDLEFSIRQLVEIAVRALSAGINDPYTAIAALDRLARAVARIMKRGTAPEIFSDADGTPRVFTPVSTFDGILDAAFNQIRQRSEGTPSVLIRLAEKLSQLIETADGQQRASLQRHLKLVISAGEREFGEEADLAALRAHAKDVSSSPVAPA